ncbi:receptor-interacting serine/threonine-protein kinase 3 isoform X5 [Pleurodeles waltl]|uniref:receptor-interacting serine/threonine-protein kinase 3 isoform X5 n=1 Tax=Pleurodeles waltl TaxID=8319 RepID=UPI003709C239
MASKHKACGTIPAEKLDSWHLIGGGSFGVIYRARHTDWRLNVAVKKLNSNFSQGLQELLSEATMMDMALPITYVIKLYGMYEGMNNDGSVCHGIVMEYLENGSLDSLQHRVYPLPWELKIRILYEVALGMNRLHSLEPPLLHLDLKPSNVLLDDEFHVRIADFGLSRFRRGASVAAGAVEDYGGTLEYMPPESLTDDIRYRPTQVFDIYSYGILMWAVLTGEVPYSAGAKHDLIKMRIPLGDRPDLDLLEKLGSVEKIDELKALMHRCWHQETSKRPTFRECSMDIENIWTVHKTGITFAVRKVQDILAVPTSHLSSQSFKHYTGNPKYPLRPMPPQPHYPLMYPYQPQYSHPPVPQISAASGYIPIICSNISGMQIGNGNTMHIDNRSQQKEKKKKKKK